MNLPEEENHPQLEHYENSHEHSGHHEYSEYKYDEVKTLLAWTAPGRPFRKRGRQFFLTTLLIALLIEVILFLFSQYLFMFVVASLVFVGFAFASVPPRNFNYKISTEGITVEDHFYLWIELYDFYFRRIEGEDTLHIRTQAFFPGEVIMTLGDIHRDQLKRAMLPFLPFRESVQKNFTEKSGDWLYKNFPLEKSSKA